MPSSASNTDRSAAQICLRWGVQKGYLPLPKTLSPARMAENLNIFSFHLEESDMAALDVMPPSLPDDRDPDSAPW
jgi:diketogulonate reductase-like aldo/keto reductase